MKSKTIIMLLVIISVLSLGFGVYQKIRADKYKAISIECERKTNELKIEIEVQKKLAEMSAQEALQQKMIADEQRIVAEKLRALADQQRKIMKKSK